MLTKAPLEKHFDPKKPLYSKTEALTEAHRCLYCYDAPCIKACPTSIEIPSFIKAISDANTDQSAHVIFRENILGYSCGRVCPVEVLCAGACVLHQRGEEPIQIGRLQHYATHHALQKNTLPHLVGPKAMPTGRRVACVGGGPASIATAGLLALKGHRVEIFEARSFAGGLNSTGIAPYKMHFDDAQLEIDQIRDLGVIFHENAPVNSSNFQTQNFDAIFLGVGIGDDTLMPDVPLHPRIVGATELIRQIKTNVHFSLEGIQVAHIIGGGNTAVDISHELALLGINEVTMVYRRSRNEMSAYKHEIDSALKDGVRILTHHQPHKIEAMPNGRFQIFFEKSSVLTDLVVIAIGQNRVMDVVKAFPEIELSEQGHILVDPLTQRTGNAKIWAGGDCTNGGKEVVNAVADAKIAAIAIHDYLISLGA